jgi:integrase
MSLTQMRQKTAPLRDIIEGFFRANYDLSPKTARWYRQNLDDFLGFVEQAHGREAILSDVDKGYVDAFLKARISRPTCRYPKGSPFAARAASATLKRFANYLASEGILADQFGTSVLKHVRRTRVDDDVRQPLSDAQLERLLDVAGRPGDRDHTMVVLLAGSGLRANEAREARVGDLDLDGGTFRVRPETSKFGRERVVYLHPAVTKELDRYLRYRHLDANPESPLFPTRAGEPFDEDGFAKVFTRLKRRSGIRGFSAHVLRHTWATNFMKAEGANLLELKRQGGWERWEMVERYSHAVPVKDRRSLPNPLEPSHKTAFGQQPSARISRLRVVG